MFKHNSKRPLKLENLDQRRLMAVNVFLQETLPGTQLHIQGDYGGHAADDHVTVERVGSSIRVIEQIGSRDFVRTFSAADVDWIFFDGKAGDDYFRNNTNLKSSALGGEGRDTLIGGGNTDVLDGGDDADTLVDYGGGTATSESQLQYFNRNYLNGGDGDDVLVAYGTANYMKGENGNDRLYGGPGADLMVGGPGNDFLYGNAGNDFLYGYTQEWGDEDWRGELSSSDWWQSQGTNDNDYLVGGYGVDRLEGGPNDDHLDGGNYGMPDGARDTLVGGTGHDRFVGYYRRIIVGGRQTVIPYDEDLREDYNHRYHYGRFYDDEWVDSDIRSWLVP